MRALDRKLIRDLGRLWLPALAISMVLACGIMTLVSMQGTEATLTLTRADYYRDQAFAQIFAHAERIPAETGKAIAALPDLERVELRSTAAGRFHLGSVEGTVQVVSLPPDGLPALNRPLLRAGLMPDPAHDGEIALAEGFAQANGLRMGDRLSLTILGRTAEYRVTGTVLSPEFIYAPRPGSMMPDDRRHGIVWITARELQALLGQPGVSNDLLATLRPGASAERAIAAIDRLLDLYGGTGAYGRDRQVSDVFLTNELAQLRTLAVWLPPVFLIVSAFLVNMVLDRLIRLERHHIGLLKAVGYGTGRIVAHYLTLAVAIGLPGLVLGWAAGWGLGVLLTDLYTEYFRFPRLAFRADAASFGWSGLAATAALVLGAARSVLSSARLPPALAMAPPAPPRFGRSLVDPLAQALGLGRLAMMVMRSVLRQPIRAGTTALGVAAAVAILVASFFTFDVIDVIMRDIFSRTNRQDVVLTLTGQAQPGALRQAALHLPGVIEAEADRIYPVRLVHGAHDRLTSLRVHEGTSRLVHVLDAQGRPASPSPAGLMLPAALAEALDAGPGDLIQVELLAAPRESYQMIVGGLVRQSMGQEAHADAALMGRLMRRPPPATAVNLRLDPTRRPAFDAAISKAPGVLAATDLTELEAQFQAEVNDSLLVETLIFSAIGMLITLGVVYNAARIQLAERAHELATLRVLGYTRTEVASVLVGEQMVVVILALPFGLLGGYGLAAAMSRGFSSEIVTMPLVVDRSTLFAAAAIALGTALVTSVAVARGLARVDLVSALKSRE